MYKKQYLYILLIAVFLSLFAAVKIGRASSALSGSCGAMMSLKQLNEIYWHMISTSNFPDGSSESASMDAMILVDFDKSKIYINVTDGTLTRNTTAPYTVASYSTRTVPAIDFTIANGPLPNSYLLTDPTNTIPNLVLLPVNSGNTFLIQAKNSKATGVCQKI